MKDIRQRIVDLVRTGYCTPQIARLARKLREPSTTIHYNLRRLEEDGIVVGYRAVLGHKVADEGFTAFVLITLAPDEYGNPERIGRDLIPHPEIESIDIITGDWEMLVKVRTKDQEAYYGFVKRVLSRKGILKLKTLTSLRELKSEFLPS